VIPLVWFGTGHYYKRGCTTPGFKVGTTFFLVAAVWDALVTVPFWVVPNGGSYAEFYLDPSFWLIGLLFIGIAMMYGYFHTNISTQKRLRSLGNPLKNKKYGNNSK